LLKLGYGDEVSNETYLGLSDADLRADPNRRYVASRLDRMQWHRTAVSLAHRVTFSPDFSVLTTLYRHDLDRTWNKVNRLGGASIASVLSDPTAGQNRIYAGVLRGELASQGDEQKVYIGPNHRVFVSQGLQSIANLRVKTGELLHRIEYGLRLHYDSVDRVHTEDGYFMRPGGELVLDGQSSLVTADNQATTAAASVYATDAMTYRRLVVTAGVRTEFIGSRFDDRLLARKEPRAGDPARKQGSLYSVVLPGLGAYYGLNREFGLLAGVNRGFSPAPPGQSSRPEFSWNVEAGARYASKKLRAELIGFYNAYQNLTNICTFSAGCTQDVDRQSSLGSATIYGAEAFVETEVRLSSAFRMPARAGYTLTLTRLNSAFRSPDPQFATVRAGDELPYVPLGQLSTSIGLEHQRYGVNLAGTYMGAMRESAGQGQAKAADLTDAYFTVDASAYAVPVKRVRLYVNGRNLTNQSYITSRRPFGARPGAPISVQLGVSAEF
jgi:Fe(3+) dicitrate transport protein